MTIARKFFLWMSSVLLVFGLLTAYGYYRMQALQEAERLEAMGAKLGAILERGLERSMMNRDLSSLAETLRDVEKIPPITGVWLIDREGQVKVAPEGSGVGTRVPLTDARCLGCHENRVKEIYLQEEGARVLVLPIMNKAKCHGCHAPSIVHNGVFVLQFSLADAQRNAKRNIVLLLFAILPFLFVADSVRRMLQKTLVTSRTDRLRDMLRRFREGDRGARIPLKSPDEFTDLERGFNDMAEAISAQERQKDDLAGRILEQYQFLQRLIDTIPIPVFYKDASGVYQGCNKAFTDFMGRPQAEIVGRTVYDLAPKELADRYHAMDRELFEQPGVQVYEYSVKHADKTRHDVLFNKATYTDLRGQVAGLLGVMQDITERKQAELTIRRNCDAQTAINWVLHISLEDLTLESILKQTLDLLLSIPWLSVEARGGIFLAEQGARLILKVQRGLPDYHREACASVPFGRCLCGKAAARGEVLFADGVDERHEISYEGMAGHGHYCVPIMHAKTVLGVITLYLSDGHRRDGREIEFLSAVASALAGIIQRKRAEEEREALILDLRSALTSVSHSRKEWQDTFDSINDMIAIIGRDFSILKANRAFAAYYGLHPRAVINRKCHELMHETAGPVPACPHQATVLEKRQRSEEVLDAKSNRLFRVTTYPYCSPEGDVIGSIHVGRDITEEKERERRLIMSERLAALGQIASGIAHEINNPLASIAGCSEGLLSRIRKGQCDPALFETYLSIIQEEVFRCKSITTAMLSFVRRTTYEKKDVPVNGMLDRTLEIIGFQGRLKNVKIARRYDEAAPIVHGNEGELRQVFLALLTNALDAINDKGALTLETGIRQGVAIIRITDSGPGIPVDALAKIFDPFFTTKGEQGGTGLGLSIARKIVMNHNGSLEATSEQGTGTTFTITLPVPG